MYFINLRLTLIILIWINNFYYQHMPKSTSKTFKRHYLFSCCIMSIQASLWRLFKSFFSSQLNRADIRSRFDLIWAIILGKTTLLLQKFNIIFKKIVNNFWFSILKVLCFTVMISVNLRYSLQPLIYSCVMLCVHTYLHISFDHQESLGLRDYIRHKAFSN